MAQITKSENDQREYRHITLPNSLDVLLISDKDADKSAVAMDVGVGYFSDPPNVPGLAHFLEHMLFMGTKKYPDENYYSEFLAKGGGSSNAYTTRENTNYYFDVLNDHFDEAIDIFAQFFINPLFLKDSVDREMNAVNQEHGKNLQSDGWRIDRVMNTLSNPNHPLSKFGTGSIETLKIDKIRDILIEFYNKYYSANLMKLVILSNKSLNQLENTARNIFSGVENKQVTRPKFDSKPFEHAKKVKTPSDQYYKLVKIVPIKTTHSICFKWQIPATKEYYLNKPVRYLSHLLGHEGKGSLYYVMKEYGWVVELFAGESGSMSTNSFVEIDIVLTDEGMKHHLDIYNLIYKYIDLLKREGVKEWIYDECRQLSDVGFRFKSKESPINYVSSLANDMFDYKKEDVLSGPYKYGPFSGDTIRMFLECMTPHNCVINIVSKNFQNSTHLKERWYGVQYSVSENKNDVELINALDANYDEVKNNKQTLFLPCKNEFIPDNFDILSDAPIFKHPQKVEILNNGYDNIELWFLQDRTFKKPKAIVKAQLKAPWIMKSANNMVKL
jgi:insulysin